MHLKTADIADPPDVVTSTVGLIVGPLQVAAGEILAPLDCFEHRAITVPPAADIIHFTDARSLEVMPERIYQVKRMNVVANLLPAVAEHDIWPADGRALHK